MNVGISGHQERDGIEWPWVRKIICEELTKLEDVYKTFSCLAAGSDQIFAEAALSIGLPVVAVIPLDGYEKFFDGGALANYKRLLANCEQRHLHWKGDAESAFFEAGKFVVEASDLLLAVWDGENADGVGGTGDVVGYARSMGRPILHINPITQSVALT